MYKRLLICLLLSGVSMVSSVHADEVSDLKKQIETQYDLLLKMQHKIAELEARQKTQDEAMTTQISEEVAKNSTGLPASISWIEKIKLSGDFRYRHEDIRDDNKADDQRRNRIRARLMIEAMVNNEWDVAFRIASGSGDPASTNQTLSDSFSSKTLWLDLAYAHYHPEWSEGLDAYIGKMKNPFFKPGKTQLLWDGDLNPEGGAMQLETSLGTASKLYTNLGAFWVDEDSGGVDTSLFGVQSYIKHTLANDDYFIAGASYFDYGNIKGRGDLKNTWSSKHSLFGNTSAGDNTFASDYNLVEVFGEYGTKIGEMPFAVFGDYVKNIVAATSQDTGWLIGCKLNKAKVPGSWEASYNYRDLEADAVLGAFSDSDFVGGGTGGRGHKFGFKYQLAKNLQTALTYILNEETRDADSDDDYKRLQLDLIYKF